MISLDMGRDLTFDSMDGVKWRVETTIEEICPHAAEAWQRFPERRGMVLAHLVHHHGLVGPDINAFLMDADYDHLRRQLGREEDIDILYKRDA